MKNILLILLVIGMASLIYEFINLGDRTKKVVLFSALEGKLVKNGQPLKNVTLVREWIFAENSVQGCDETTTDAEGRFSFPVVVHNYRRPLILAQEFIVSQSIRLRTEEQDLRLWMGSKHSHEAGSEASMDPIKATDPEIPLYVTIDLDVPRALRGAVVGHTLFENGK